MSRLSEAQRSRAGLLSHLRGAIRYQDHRLRQRQHRAVGPEVARIKSRTPLPVCVGFGIKIPETAAEIAGIADGAVVGSAIVDPIARGDRAEDVRAFVKSLAMGTHA